MEKFAFKVDINAPYIKTIRFIGTFILGLVVGAILIKFKNGSDIDWLNAVTAIILCFYFAFYPGRAKQKSLTIDEKGIHMHNYNSYWRQRKKDIPWESISTISIDKNVLCIKKSIGSRTKITLPIHTKEQIVNLKSYLKNNTSFKKVTYLA